ncbi:Hypothetical predicted protein [Mytilus galloprovincialis]|uniref:RING-type domain-containing protein n=1 Tax=Mytilus galloprovincialis TaxID=29158 RepID=A0A8B6CYB0_MYTGA|nr:Hypothetical predicted protein [Mytilus galloprovincialis]
MPTIFRRRERDKMSEDVVPSSVVKHLSAIAVPGMYLYYKYNEFKRQRIEDMKRKVTERELDHLNQKIGRLLAKIDESETEFDYLQDTPDDECVICLSAKATMRTFPCGHKVVCRMCFIKTIQSAVSQRCLPLRCVVCRERILKLRQSSKVQSSSQKTGCKSIRQRLFPRAIKSTRNQHKCRK